MRARWTLALLLLAAACGDPQPEPRAEQAARVPAPDFTLPDLGGDPVQLSSLRGKTVLLDFWATWCPPCVYQVPELNELWAAHAGADDLVILGISVDIDGVEVVEPWVREYGVEYTIVMGDEALAREFGALGFPSLVAISPDGFIDSIHAGVIEYDELEAASEGVAVSDCGVHQYIAKVEGCDPNEYEHSDLEAASEDAAISVVFNV